MAAACGNVVRRTADHRLSRSAGVDVAAVADGRDADNAPLIIDRVHDPVVTDPNAPPPA